jgi:hypothetical protein
LSRGAVYSDIDVMIVVRRPVGKIIDIKLEAEDQGLLVEAGGYQDADPWGVREGPRIDM